MIGLTCIVEGCLFCEATLAETNVWTWVYIYTKNPYFSDILHRSSNTIPASIFQESLTALQDIVVTKGHFDLIGRPVMMGLSVAPSMSHVYWCLLKWEEPVRQNRHLDDGFYFSIRYLKSKDLPLEELNRHIFETTDYHSNCPYLLVPHLNKKKLNQPTPTPTCSGIKFLGCILQANWL